MQMFQSQGKHKHYWSSTLYISFGEISPLYSMQSKSLYKSRVEVSLEEQETIEFVSVAYLAYLACIVKFKLMQLFTSANATIKNCHQKQLIWVSWLSWAVFSTANQPKTRQDFKFPSIKMAHHTTFIYFTLHVVVQLKELTVRQKTCLVGGLNTASSNTLNQT